MKNELYPRHAEKPLRELLKVFPAVMINGPRQCGKTTLAEMAGIPRGYRRIDFYSKDVREYAERSPEAFMRELPERAILDEIQLVPDLFGALKQEIDRDRVNGRFILLGSSNTTLLSHATALTGRMADIQLRPLSQAELSRQTPHFIDHLFSQEFGSRKHLGEDPKIIDRIISGGYPSALEMPLGRLRKQWYQKHINGIIQRDVRELLRIQSLDVFHTLLASAAEQTSGLWNVNRLCSPLDISLPTAHKHIKLLEQMLLLERLCPWRESKAQQLLKTPKMHLCDTGIACALMNVDFEEPKVPRSLYGYLLETFVFQELVRQSSGSGEERFNFYRDKKQYEVDIVIQRGADQSVGIEVKAASTIDKSDLRGLRRMRDVLGDRFKCGVVLHEGDYPQKFDDQLFALPIRMLWESSDSVDASANVH